MIYRTRCWRNIGFLALLVLEASRPARASESEAPGGGVSADVRDRIAAYYESRGVQASVWDQFEAAEYDEEEYRRFVRRGVKVDTRVPIADPARIPPPGPAPKWWQELSAAKSSLTLTEETEVGLMVAGRVLREYPLWEDAESTKYVRFVGRYVAEQSMRPDIPYKFFIIQGKSPAAYSTPGGFLFVSTGLLQLLSDEDELAFVLGHEVAHVARFHGILEVERTATTRRANEALEELDTMSQKSGGEKPDLEAIADEAFKVFTGFRSRAEEDQADALGVDFTIRGGYRKECGVEVLGLLQKKLGDGPEASESDTHPKFSERIQALERHLKSKAGSSPRRRMTSTQKRFDQLRKSLSGKE
ncbi:MAG: M48 family metalloprotease [Planctomycetes bacterium]|nr:M48 family metalloprotease [Planctomycetota bacterium]